MDYFALLGVPRQAVLDSDELKTRYHAVSRKTHPDARPTDGDGDGDGGGGGTQIDSSEINAAYQCLSQPSARLRHLLELVAPDAGDQLKGGQIPAPFMEIFSRLASAVQGADTVIAEKKAATSALSMALLAAAEMEAREALEAAGMLIARQRAVLETGALPEIDTLLAAAPESPETAAKIARAFRAFGFLDKWQAQVRGKLLEILEAGV